METDVVEQILAIALHPAYDCYTAKISVETIVNLTQRPESHTHIVRKEFLEIMLELSEQRYKMINEQSAQTLNQQGKKEDPMVINALKYVPVASIYILCSFSFHKVVHACIHAHTVTRTHTYTQASVYMHTHTQANTIDSLP
jgi:hypothetical protein